MKKVLLFSFLFLILSSCFNDTEERRKAAIDRQFAAAQTNKPEPPAYNPEDYVKWRYESKTDPMTDAQIHYAYIRANEVLQFDFPYDGGAIAELWIRKNAKGLNIYLTVSEGQFYSRNYNNKVVKVRFDENTAQTYNYNEASDGSSNILFIRNAALFLSNLKKAKKLIIQAEFFNEGIRTLTFDVENLNWTH